MSTAAPSRKEARERARAERRRREHEAELHAARKRRLMWIGGGALAVVVLIAVVIAVASGGSSSSKTAAGGSSAAGAAAVRSEFAGIPQSGLVLGSPAAPAEMMVFADPQCPFCAHFDNDVMPSLVQRYVRAGKLKLIFQPISILGPQSDAAARALAAASLQDRLWQYAALFYRNQGTENTGYVTDSFLEKLAKATPGLDVARFTRDLSGQEASSVFSRAQAASNTAGVRSTPTFMVAKNGKTFEQFVPSQLKPQAFYGRLDKLTS